MKFKRAGEGHKLTDDTKSAGGPSSRPQSVQASRSGLSEEAARAAEAALIRTSKTQNKSGEYSLNFEVHLINLSDRKNKSWYRKIWHKYVINLPYV